MLRTTPHFSCLFDKRQRLRPFSEVALINQLPAYRFENTLQLGKREFRREALERDGRAVNLIREHQACCLNDLSMIERNGR